MMMIMIVVVCGMLLRDVSHTVNNIDSGGGLSFITLPTCSKIVWLITASFDNFSVTAAGHWPLFCCR